MATIRFFARFALARLLFAIPNPTLFVGKNLATATHGRQGLTFSGQLMVGLGCRRRDVGG